MFVDTVCPGFKDQHTADKMTDEKALALQLCNVIPDLNNSSGEVADFSP